MKPNHLLVVVYLVATLIGLSEAQAGDYLVVAHKSAGFSSASQEEIANLFLLRSDNITGASVKVVNLSEKAQKLAFLARLTDKSEREVEDHFVKLELRGEGKWPSEVNDGSALVKLIAKSKKVVGWLSEADYALLSEKEKSLLVVLLTL